MNHGLNRLRELPVSVRLIREIHSKLLEGVRGSRLTPGNLRTSQNWTRNRRFLCQNYIGLFHDPVMEAAP